jgi:hypothetical protein
MMPFLRHRPSDRWWRLSLGFLWLPALVVVITVGDWIHLSQSIVWISLGVLLVGYLAFVFVVDRRLS